MMTLRSLLARVGPVLVLAVAACGGNVPTDDAEPDAALDSGTDAAFEGGTGFFDGGTGGFDGAAQTAAEAGPDGTLDVAADAIADAPFEASSEAAAVDALADAGGDAGPDASLQPALDAAAEAAIDASSGGSADASVDAPADAVTDGADAGSTGTSDSSTLDSWLTTPTPANEAGNYPYPQNRKLARCTYPTTIANTVILARYITWKAEMVVSSGAPSGALRVQDPNGTPANRTVSEGIGYGMLIAVYFADKATFDGLWAYASAHMSNGLMSWNIDPAGNPYNDDTHSDTSADEDMAWALLMADRQWGGSYLSAAETLIANIHLNEVSGSTVMSGDFNGGPTYYDYAAPAYYPAFAVASGDASWNALVGGELSQLVGVQNSRTGLTPDSSGSTVFGYDAVRSPWRVGFDYCLHGTAQSQTYLSTVVPFLVNYASTNGGPSALKLPITLMGTMGSDPAGAINGPAAVGAMMSVANQAFIDASYTYLATTIVPETSAQSAIGPNYYSSTLGLIALLTLSGNFIDYTSL